MRSFPKVLEGGVHFYDRLEHLDVFADLLEEPSGCLANCGLRIIHLSY
jgi:hypothetical protein